METLEAVLQINLNKRTDRRLEIENELRQAGFSDDAIHRIEAIENVNGNLGCSMSHAKALEYALEKNFHRFLVVEDDFQLCVEPAVFRERLNAMHSLDFDVLMVAHNTQKSKRHNPWIVRVQKSQTRAGQIVNQKFIPTLLQNFRETVDIMQKRGRGFHGSFGDQHWKTIQESSKWYAFDPRLAKQRPSYSDNEKKFTHQGV